MSAFRSNPEGICSHRAARAAMPTRGRASCSLGRLTGVTSRRTVCIHWQGKLKRGTVGYVCRGPQPAIVSFHDRTADRESHTHAAGFGSEEGIEQSVRILGRDPDAAIRHTYEHLLCLVLTG